MESPDHTQTQADASAAQVQQRQEERWCAITRRARARALRGRPSRPSTRARAALDAPGREIIALSDAERDALRRAGSRWSRRSRPPRK